MIVRPYNPETDYPMICEWWTKHGSLPVPKLMFVGAQGFFAEDNGIKAAVSFLYLIVGGKSAIIEWTTTNPDASARSKLSGVKALYSHLEALAQDHGCIAAYSFVKPGSSEERMFTKLGYFTTPDDPGHKIYCKNINKEALCPCS